MQKIKFSCKTGSTELEFDDKLENIKLSTARQRLKENNFFRDASGDDQSSRFRFLFPRITTSGSTEDLVLSDRLAALSIESHLSIQDVILNSGTEVVLTDVKTKSKERPDLIGFQTSSFKSRNLQVACRLRPDFKAPGAAEPILLTDVMTAKLDASEQIHYPFFIICTQGSVLEFPVACKCSVGMAYSAWMNGERIFDYATPLGPYIHDDIAYGCCDAFNNGDYSNEKQGPKTIKAEKVSSTSGGAGGYVSYEITIKAEDVTQWSAQKNGKCVGTYTKDSRKPLQTSKKLNSLNNGTMCFARAMSDNMVTLGSIGTNSNASGGDDTTYDQMSVDGTDYFAGKLVPGESMPKKLPGVDTFSVDKTGGILGSIQICIAVFDTMETALKYINRYNPPVGEI